MKRIYNILPLLLVYLSSCHTTADFSDLKQGYQHYENKEYAKAQPYFEQQLTSFVNLEQSPKLYFHYAYTHFHLKNYDFSAYYFNRFIERFEQSSYAEEAAYRSPDSHYHMMPNAFLSQEASYSAINGFQHFIYKYPSSSFVGEAKKKLDDLNKKLYQKEHQTALNYFHWKNFTAAKTCFKKLLLDYPNSTEKDWHLFMIFKSSYQLAKQYRFKVPATQIQLLLKDYNNLNKKHPESRYTKQSEQLLRRAKILS